MLAGVPFVLMLNKADLVEKWEVDDSAVEDLVAQGWPTFRTSAKTGEGVEEAFLALARRMAGA
jgi:putative ribosome biogenesis GTPase RsgA